MADLYKDPLGSLQLSDLETFLGISATAPAPIVQRPAEGTRLDFKKMLIPDIGLFVASMANTAGGLLFIGIEAERPGSLKQNVANAAPGDNLGPDPTARIANMIITTVSPRPSYEIGIFPLTASSAVALIRVDQGNYPPYEYTRSGDYKIPIRVLDTTRQASLREIEELLNRRAA